MRLLKKFDVASTRAAPPAPQPRNLEAPPPAPRVQAPLEAGLRSPAADQPGAPSAARPLSNKPEPIPQEAPSFDPAAGPAAVTGTEIYAGGVLERDLQAKLAAMSDLAGFVGACLVDSETGLMMASQGGGDRLDLLAAAALNTEVIRAERQAIREMGLQDEVEEILVTLGQQLHIIRPLAEAPGLFLYVALQGSGANLGMARMHLKRIEGTLRI